MTRVILCPVGSKPRVTEIAADPDGGHATALNKLLGIPVARLALCDGIEIRCDRDCLLYGLALARRASVRPIAEPLQRRIMLRFDGVPSTLTPNEWPVIADFLLARATADGKLVDLTTADIRRWLFWLGLDYIMNP